LWTSACAQSKKTAVRSGTAQMRVSSATLQRTTPGREESEPVSNYRIRAQWRGARAPQAFYWRPDGEGWMNCSVVRERADGGADEVSPESLRKGQTFLLLPQAGGRMAIPDFVKSTTRNTLFSQVGGVWYSLPVAVTTQSARVGQ